MELLTQSITPLYAQIAIFDPDMPDAYPDWGDGEDEVVQTRHGIAVATIPDVRGRVWVRVVRDEPGDASARVLYEGAILTTAGRLHVGSVPAAQLFEVGLDPGEHQIRLETTAPVEAVDNVTIRIN